MNTISPVQGLLSSPSSRKAFRAHFKLLAHCRGLTASHMAVYALALGKPLGTTFSPIQNIVKLANGQRAWGGALDAIYQAGRSIWAKELFAALDLPDQFDAMQREGAVIGPAELQAQFDQRA